MASCPPPVSGQDYSAIRPREPASSMPAPAEFADWADIERPYSSQPPRYGPAYTRLRLNT
jgi:hypothetical protein